MRERLVFDGRIQGHGANMKFLSKQPLYIKMTYTCGKHSVGGIGATHEAPPNLKIPQKKYVASLCNIFLCFAIVCFIGVLMGVFLTDTAEMWQMCLL